ncbi:MAG: FimB/Mfa2 family fimbrial subunit [Bacteroidaceae bacterium]|nr:FimB/Mfa2 family fimbrial subunit [Bacteroidaceae bacterium]
MSKVSSILSAFHALAIAITLASCEKVAIPENDASEELNGNLRVSVYQIEQTPFASSTRTTEAASAACTKLNFAIYDEGGSRLKQINQQSSAADFGSVAFQLDEGTYQLVVVGHSANGNPTMTDPTKIQFSNATGYTDTFLCYGEVTIGEEPVDYEVSLDRIVALCRFVITDDIPAEVKKLRFYYTGGSGAFNAVTGLGCVASKQDVKFDVTPTGSKQFDLYTFLHDLSDNIALTVMALDASGNELYSRQFDVPMQQNHITWLSGAFFSGSGSSSTTISGVTVNTDWAGETHLTF